VLFTINSIFSEANWRQQAAFANVWKLIWVWCQANGFMHWLIPVCCRRSTMQLIDYYFDINHQRPFDWIAQKSIVSWSISKYLFEIFISFPVSNVKQSIAAQDAQLLWTFRTTNNSRANSRSQEYEVSMWKDCTLDQCKFDKIFCSANIFSDNTDKFAYLYEHFPIVFRQFLTTYPLYLGNGKYAHNRSSHNQCTNSRSRWKSTQITTFWSIHVSIIDQNVCFSLYSQDRIECGR
jgi:hypothetical protein